MKYRNKPVVIEAHQFTDRIWDDENSDHPEWIQEAIENGTIFVEGLNTLIRAREGNHLVDEDDFIIKGVKGELYPCKPDIFALTYETAE